jgi:F-type H+-transporting ATPase subunit b
MLEFHPWDFAILIVNFIVLYFILNYLLFQPLKKIFIQREAATKGALDEARSLTTKKDNAIAAMNAELAQAVEKAKVGRNALREQGVERQKEMTTKSESEALAMISKAQTELQKETKKLRAGMKADVEKFSEEIVRKLVKV